MRLWNIENRFTRQIPYLLFHSDGQRDKIQQDKIFYTTAININLVKLQLAKASFQNLWYPKA